MPAEMLRNPKVSTNDAPPALLTESLIRRHFVPCGGRTLARWISAGRFPRADIAIGNKIRYWRVETVLAWIADRAAEGGAP
jgi:predicted DNA-binding transcriptional regulator AlpA